MTSLPQMSDIEAQAVGYATDWLTEFRDLFCREINRIFVREMLKDYARFHPFGMSNLMHDARNGWEDAHLALGEMIVDYQRKGEQLPPQLASYCIDLLNPHLPPRLRGPNKASSITRNIVIVAVVDELVQRFGLHAVRSRSSKAPRRRPSACAILALARAAEKPSGRVVGVRAGQLRW